MPAFTAQGSLMLLPHCWLVRLHVIRHYIFLLVACQPGLCICCPLQCTNQHPLRVYSLGFLVIPTVASPPTCLEPTLQLHRGVGMATQCLPQCSWCKPETILCTERHPVCPAMLPPNNPQQPLRVPNGTLCDSHAPSVAPRLNPHSAPPTSSHALLPTRHWASCQGHGWSPGQPQTTGHCSAPR